MAGNNALQETLKAGIEAARRGDRNTARRLLRQVVTVNPDSEVAWMWLASAVESLDERRECLENALRINPKNTRAREALERLGGTTPRVERVLRETASPSVPRPERRRAVPEPVITSDRRTIMGYAIIALAIIIVLVVVAGLVSGVLEQNALSSQATQAAIRQAAVIPTIAPTIDPDTYTATPFIGLLVPAPSFVPTLPPTFTPTFTPTATMTPPPT
ncbi:MAG: hypothetical protein K8I60_06885, partial [Anaerolineae bacterium]|nr:hypothetical protein [Anaerolineae bacterium]